MAIYHFNAKIISRANGQSVIAAAAYRTAALLLSQYNGVSYDYRRKRGVVYDDILLPENAPTEWKSREVLWNTVEKSEKQANSQLAREINIALPVELNDEQQKTLIWSFVQHTFVDNGMCADIAIHDKKDGNPHAHILLTMRAVTLDGQLAPKSKKEYILDKNGEKIKLPSGEWKSKKINMVNWNDDITLDSWRQDWELNCNAALEKAGRTERIDCRNFEDQGLIKEPTIHMGKTATTFEKKGIHTDRGNINREIKKRNDDFARLASETKQPTTRILSFAQQQLKTTIDATIKRVGSFDEFIALMAKAGYDIKWGKYIAFVPVGENRYLRATSLGREYNERAIRWRLNGTSWRRKQEEYQNTSKTAELDKHRQRSNYTKNSKTKPLNLELYLKYKNRYTALNNIQKTANEVRVIRQYGIEHFADFTTKLNELRGQIANAEDILGKLEGTAVACEQISKLKETKEKNQVIYTKYTNMVFGKKIFEAEHKLEIKEYINANNRLNMLNIKTETTAADAQTMAEKLYSEADTKRKSLETVKKQFSTLTAAQRSIECSIAAAKGNKKKTVDFHIGKSI